ncbi:MAG: hypothetical protein IPN34_18195 [Planctomycetes bacterium]|nr:hypothetical protein [Planctomycetota bacterium]
MKPAFRKTLVCPDWRERDDAHDRNILETSCSWAVMGSVARQFLSMIAVPGLLRRAGEFVREGDPLCHVVEPAVVSVPVQLRSDPRVAEWAIALHVEPHGDELPGQSLRIYLSPR